ncbi:MAG: class I SAM-dependent methyltransferase [Bacteroidales bacterium]|jgi:ubiquinone/menaquinone biosynthesis C-methylase UbiE|nr:class I SAM-dependent methyltransferase [Bacteroidales bacterium]
MDNHLNNPKSPKFHVKKYFESIADELVGKTVADLPAGSGVTSRLLKDHGANVLAFDLFPEYFQESDITCTRADVLKGIPITDSSVDMFICQEGIEHFSDQLKAFKEFGRVLKTGGKLIITAPSYSNLAARFSYLLFESETNRQMPPNEIDDIWMEDKSVSDEIYHGHIFLIGLQKMRVLAKLAGFKISEVKYLRISKSSLFLLPIFYPWIFVSSYMRYKRNLKKHKNIPIDILRNVYGEQYKLNISIKNLLNHHLFVIFEKENDAEKLSFRHEDLVRGFENLT